MFFVKFSLKIATTFYLRPKQKTLLFLSHFFGYKVSPFVGTTRRHFFFERMKPLEVSSRTLKFERIHLSQFDKRSISWS